MTYGFTEDASKPAPMMKELTKVERLEPRDGRDRIAA
jgi:hypothetical protein